MSAVAFDTLRFARRLKDAGVPEKQAEAQAEVMAETFVYNMDSLVTTDYLDARFAEQGVRFEARFAEQDARLGARFVEQDARFDARFVDQDTRLDSLEAGMNERFTEQGEAFSKRFMAMDIKFTELKGELKGELGLQRWILAAIAASTVLPALNSVFSLA
jgi:hypothetical protein